MHARRLRTPEERLQYEINAATCFHYALDVDKRLQELREKPDERELCGAFDDDGTLMARIIHHRFALHLDGKEIPAGGIGAVSTLPEFRDRGAEPEQRRRT